MDFEAFVALVVAVLGTNRRPNTEQLDCLRHNPAQPLLIVAGPGTGKTTVLVLRALRHVLVDRIAPEQIMITTFTRKAAKEIRTRLIEWGTPLVDHLLAAGARRLDPQYREFLRRVDINRFVTGTLDSICEEVLSSAREPNERPPTVVESFAANQILARRGDIFAESQQVGQSFADYLGRYTLSGDPPQTVGDMTRVVRTLIDRIVQDEVDLAAYLRARTDRASRQAVGRIFDRYREHLRSTNQMDFAALERVFLDRLVAGRLTDLTANLRVLLVDEYQDTNPLQERIYLQLAASTRSSLTVVGDDDQSLYRFRGATIELFRDFVIRSRATLGRPDPRLVYLVGNYRSTPEIVAFFNRFVQNDPDFAGARIQPPKPAIRHTQASNRVPILGMFRDTADELGVDLANFLHLIFRGGGRPGDTQLPETIRAGVGGDFGDAVLLASTVNEFTRPSFGNPGRARLPWELRQRFQALGVSCFNPRGRALKDIPEVALLLGLVLEAIDPASPAAPDGAVTAAMRITNVARDAFREWRMNATDFLATRPRAVNGGSLNTVLNEWRAFATRGQGGSANEWPILDVFYSLIPWVPAFQDDPECQVYLEAISRCAAEASTFSGYRALLLRQEPHRTRSVQSIIRDVLAPVADDLVEVDEDIMPSVPRNRFNLMTIHQAKGLEFPLVVVDIASDFKTNHVKQRFRRFPDNPSPVAVMEDDLASCTPIGALRTQRSGLQRSFEDLIRLYYVAYSRPQSVLMLVGCLPCLRYNTTIPHVATFWRSNRTWPWRRDGSSPRPSMADDLPFIAL